MNKIYGSKTQVHLDSINLLKNRNKNRKRLHIITNAHQTAAIDFFEFPNWSLCFGTIFVLFFLCVFFSFLVDGMALKLDPIYDRKFFKHSPKTTKHTVIQLLIWPVASRIFFVAVCVWSVIMPLTHSPIKCFFVSLFTHKWIYKMHAKCKHTKFALSFFHLHITNNIWTVGHFP